MTLPYYSIGGATADPGGSSIAGAVDMVPNAVTFPTIGVSTVDPVLSGLMATSGVGYNHTWHKFTATESGNLIFDLLLSYPTTGVEDQSNTNPYAYLDLYRSNVGPNPTSAAGLTHLFGQYGDSTYFPRKRARATYSVTAGTTYVLLLWSPSVTPASLYFVFRMSAYGAVTPYIQGSDEAWTLQNPWTGFGGVNSIHTDSLVPKTYYYDGSLKGTNQPADGATSFGGFIGGDEMDQSFGGPAPAGDTDARQCSWRWARTGQWGGQWWSLSPDGPNPASWNGTDPYDSGVPGSGTCRTHNGNAQYYVAGGVSSPVGGVGVWWSGSADTDGHNSTNFFSFGQGQSLWVRKALGQFHADAGRGTPTDTPGGGAILEWEAVTPTLLGVDASPDQTASLSTYENDGLTGIDPNPLAVQWYIKSVGYTISDQNPSNTWGPTAGATPGWMGGTGLSSFPGDQDMQLPDMTGRSGGIDDISWKPIPDALLAEALSYEDAWQAQWDSGIGTGDISWWTGALRAVALYPEMFSDTVPPLDYAGWSYGTAHRSDRYRTFQCVAWRMRLRPARHRWRSVPVVPAVAEEFLDISAVPGPPRIRFYS